MSERCRCGQPRNTTHVCDRKDLILADYKEALTAANGRAEKAEKRLAWWETPHDQEQFDAIRTQASHKDSLAAQTIYIGHLERRVKELQARIDESQKPIGEKSANGIEWEFAETVHNLPIGTKLYTIIPDVE